MLLFSNFVEKFQIFINWLSYVYPHEHQIGDRVPAYFCQQSTDREIMKEKKVRFIELLRSIAIEGTEVPGACGINSNSTRKIWKYE